MTFWTWVSSAPCCIATIIENSSSQRFAFRFRVSCSRAESEPIPLIIGFGFQLVLLTRRRFGRDLFPLDLAHNVNQAFVDLEQEAVRQGPAVRAAHVGEDGFLALGLVDRDI